MELVWQGDMAEGTESASGLNCILRLFNHKTYWRWEAIVGYKTDFGWDRERKANGWHGEREICKTNSELAIKLFLDLARVENAIGVTRPAERPGLPKIV